MFLHLRKSIGILALLLFVTIYAGAQDVGWNVPQALKVCGAEQVATVTITNNTATVISAGTLVIPQLTGIVFNPQASAGWTNVTTGTTVLTFTHAALNPKESLVLKIGVSSPCQAITSGSQVRFTANYTAIQNGAPVAVTKQSNTINIADISFNISYPSVNDNTVADFPNTHTTNTKQVMLTVSGNDLASQPFGVKLTSSVDVSIVNTIAIQYGGSTLSPGTDYTLTLTPGTATTADVLVIDFVGTGALSQLANNENIIISYSFKPKKCFLGSQQAATVMAYKKCEGGSICQKASNLLYFKWQDVKATGLTRVITSTKTYNLCGGKSRFRIEYKNTGTSAYYDLMVYFYKHNNVQISNVTMNGLPFTYNHAIGTNNVASAPSLSSVGGDAAIVDLLSNQTLVVEFDYEVVNPDMNSCNGLTHYFVEPWLYTKISECANHGILNAGRYGASISKRSLDLTGPVDLDQGQTGNYSLCGSFELLPSELIEDKFKLAFDLTLPCGVRLDLTTPINFTANSVGSNYPTMNMVLVGSPQANANNTTTYHLLAANYFNYSGLQVPNGGFTPMNTAGANLAGCIAFKTIVDAASCATCNSNTTQSEVKAELGLVFNECASNANAILKFACVSKDLYVHCATGPGDGPCNVVQNPIDVTAFSAIRKTYGYTDVTMSHQITFAEAQASTNLKKKGAYACDEIITTTTGNIFCTKTGNYFGYVYYDKPATAAVPTLVLQSASVNNGGTIVSGLSFSRVTSLETATRIVYAVNFGTLNVVAGQTLKMDCTFKVDESLNSSPAYANVNMLRNFRSGFSHLGTLLPSEHYGDELELYKIVATLTHGDLNGNLSFYCGYPTNSVKYLTVSGGTSGDDFPNEYRPLFPYNGNLTITIPPALQADLSVASVNYILGSPSINQLLPLSGSGGVYTITPPTGGWKGIEKNASIVYSYFQIKYDYKKCITSEVTLSGINSTIAYTDMCQNAKNFTDNVNLRILPLPANAFLVQSLNASVEALSTTNVFNLQISNQASIGVMHPWIKVTYPASDLSVSVSNTSAFAGATLITDTPGTLFIKLNAVNQGSTDLREFLTITPLNCNSDQTVNLTMEYGISCSSILGTTMSEINAQNLCSRGSQALQVKLSKADLGMDVLPLFDVNVPQDGCKPLKYLVQIFDTERAGISNPKLDLQLPTGYSINGISYKYPLNVSDVVDPLTFNYTSFSGTGFNPATSPSTSWNLQNAAGNLAILPGLAGNSSTSVRNNFYQAILTVLPSCDIKTVEPLKIKVSGKTPCDELKQIESSHTVKIKGLENISNFDYTFDVAVKSSTPCGSYTATITYNSSTGLAGNTANLTVALPSGFTPTSGMTFGPLPTAANTSATYTFTFTAPQDFCGEAVFKSTVKVKSQIACNGNTCESFINFDKEDGAEVCCVQIAECNVEPVMVILNGSENPCTTMDCRAIAVFNNTNLTGSQYMYGTVDWSIKNVVTGAMVLTQTNPTNGFVHTFAANGKYEVCMTLNLVNDKGVPCVKTICKTIEIKCETCEFDAELEITQPSRRCLYHNFTSSFVGTSPNYIGSATWQIKKEGVVIHSITSSVLQAMNYTMPSNGEYEVCLILVGGDSEAEACKKTFCKTFTVDCPCSIDAALTISSGIEPCSYAISPTVNIANGTIVSYQWTIRSAPHGGVAYTQSGTGTPTNFTHTLPNGSYRVFLEVIGSNCRMTVSEPLTVNCCVVEDFNFEVDQPQRNCFHRQFNPTTLSDPTGVTYTWEITKNGNPVWSSAVLTGQLVALPYTFTASGTYLVKLIVTKTVGRDVCSKTKEQTVVIDCPPAPCLVTANFNARINGCSAQFTDISTTSAGATIISRDWNFGEGYTMIPIGTNEASVLVQFDNLSSATQTVTLTVVAELNGVQCTHTFTKPLRFSKRCVGLILDPFEIGIAPTPAPEPVQEIETIQMYPNPTSGLFTLRVTDIWRNAIVTVTTPDERVVATSMITSETLDIDLTSQVSGIYTVTITGNGMTRRLQLSKN